MEDKLKARAKTNWTLRRFWPWNENFHMLHRCLCIESGRIVFLKNKQREILFIYFFKICFCGHTLFRFIFTRQCFYSGWVIYLLRSWWSMLEHKWSILSNIDCIISILISNFFTFYRPLIQIKVHVHVLRLHYIITTVYSLLQ